MGYYPYPVPLFQMIAPGKDRPALRGEGSRLNYKDISAMVIDETNALIYISDPETYELLYLNQATLRVLGNPAREQWFGQPCYKVLQGKEQPCDFCTNSRLNKDSFYIWEHYNEMVGRYFTLKDKFVEMDGRLVRLEIADDVTLMLSLIHI